MEDYLRVNADHADLIAEEAAHLDGGMTDHERAILLSFLEARPAYLRAYFDEIDRLYGSFAAYLREGLHLDPRSNREPSRPGGRERERAPATRAPSQRPITKAYRMRRLTSFSWRPVTALGAPVMGSLALLVFGKAMTSRMESLPGPAGMTRRSQPKAMPPCGGAPSSRASQQEAELLVDLLIGRAPRRAGCGAGPRALWMRMVPPPTSKPSHDQVVGVAAAGAARIALDLVQITRASSTWVKGWCSASVLLLVLVVGWNMGKFTTHTQTRGPRRGMFMALGRCAGAGRRAPRWRSRASSAANSKMQSPGSTSISAFRAAHSSSVKNFLMRALLLAIGGERHPGHALGAVGLGDAGELLHLAAGPVAGTLDVDGLHHAAGLGYGSEHLEAGVLHNVGDVVTS